MSGNTQFYREGKFQDTQIGKIPSDWKMATLSELSEPITKGTTPTTYGFEYTTSGVNFLKVESIDEHGAFIPENISHVSKEANKASSRSILKQDDILFSIAGALGRVALVTKDILPANTNQALAIVRIKEKNIALTEYLKYFLMGPHIQKFVKSIAIQSQQSNLNLEQVRKFWVGLPSLVEQKAIVEVLGVADSAIELADKVIAKTERLKKGLMQQLLTRGIGHTEYKDTPIGRIPEEWRFDKLAELSKTKDSPVQTGPFGAQLHASDYVENGVPLILIKNVLDGQIWEEDMPRVAEAKATELKRYRLKTGDIVFSRVGSVGRAAIVNKHQEGWLVSGQMLRVRLENPEISNEFLRYAIATAWFQKALASRTVGATRKSINTEILSNLPMVVPNLPEQQKVADFLLNVDKKLELERKQKTKLERIKQGLMELLLTGKVRIKVD